MGAKTQIDTYPPLPDSDHITGTEKISKFLQRFTKHYTPLTVRIPNHKQHYTSCIVSVEQDHLLLDELLPSTGHQQLIEERALIARGKLDGVDIQFATTLQHAGNKDNLVTYYMDIPRLVEHRQRRETFRARIPVTMKLPVFVENKKGEKVKGELHNLSYGGAGMIMLPDKTIMEKGAMHKCTIQLAKDEWIDCTVELRFAKSIPARNTQFIGTQFIDLSATQSRLIGRCINELERRRIRQGV